MNQGGPIVLATSRARLSRIVAVVALALVGTIGMSSVADQAAYASIERKGANHVGRHARSVVAVTASSSPAQDAIQTARPQRRLESPTRRVLAYTSQSTQAAQSQSHVAQHVAFRVREAAATTTRLRAPPLAFHS